MWVGEYVCVTEGEYVLCDGGGREGAGRGQDCFSKITSRFV